MEKIGDTGSQLSAAEDAKATAASKMTPAEGTLDTPEAEKALQKQKGNRPDLAAGSHDLSRLLTL